MLSMQFQNSFSQLSEGDGPHSHELPQSGDLRSMVFGQVSVEGGVPATGSPVGRDSICTTRAIMATKATM